VDLGVGDGALAGDRPVVAVDAHDGRGQRAAGVARVENKREAVAQLLDDLLAPKTIAVVGAPNYLSMASMVCCNAVAGTRNNPE